MHWSPHPDVHRLQCHKRPAAVHQRRTRSLAARQMHPSSSHHCRRYRSHPNHQTSAQSLVRLRQQPLTCHRIVLTSRQTPTRPRAAACQDTSCSLRPAAARHLPASGTTAANTSRRCRVRPVRTTPSRRSTLQICMQCLGLSRLPPEPMTSTRVACGRCAAERNVRRLGFLQLVIKRQRWARRSPVSVLKGRCSHRALAALLALVSRRDRCTSVWSTSAWRHSTLRLSMRLAPRISSAASARVRERESRAYVYRERERACALEGAAARGDDAPKRRQQMLQTTVARVGGPWRMLREWPRAVAYVAADGSEVDDRADGRTRR